MTFMGPLKRVTAQVGLEQGLGLKSTSVTQAILCRFRPSHGPLTHYDVATTDCVVFDQTTNKFTKSRESTETVSGWILVLE